MLQPRGMAATKRCTLRARLTVCLSSSLNSSIPQMAMMSCNSLGRINFTRWCNQPSDSWPTISARRIRDVESTDPPQGKYPTRLSYGSIRLWHPSARRLLLVLVSQVIGRNVNGLNRCDGTILGWCDALLHGTHFCCQCRLETHGRRHTT